MTITDDLLHSIYKRTFDCSSFKGSAQEYATLLSTFCKEYPSYSPTVNHYVHSYNARNKIKVAYILDNSFDEPAVRVFDKTKHFFDIGSNGWFLSKDNFVEIQREDSSKNFWMNRNYLSNVGFKCERTNSFYYRQEFTQVYVYIWRQYVCFEKFKNEIDLYAGAYYPISYLEAEILSYTAQKRNSPVLRLIEDYHCSPRPDWWKEKTGIGMELECYVTKRDEFVHTVHSDILTELDGSLSESYGVELIGGPYTLEEYLDDCTPWKDTVSNAIKKGGKGHGAGTDYGIHLSISRSLFTSLHAAKFIMFMNQQSCLVKIVAQRSDIYQGGYKNYPKYKGLVANEWDIDSYDKETGLFSRRLTTVKTGRYEPVHATDKRLEVRVFRSSLKWERILKNIEFVQAVYEFSRDCKIENVTDEIKGTEVFLDWLEKSGKFKHLKEFLMYIKSVKTYKPSKECVDSHSLLKNFNYIAPKKSIVKK